MDDEPLRAPSRRATLAYAAPAFALALLGVPVFVHLPRFYAESLAVPLAPLGLAILLTRALDAALDPLIGAWSDRTRSRWGRRRPFIALAAVPLGASVVALFTPPVSGPTAVWWFAGTMAVAFTAWTAVQVPHAALGPELARGYHARTRLFAVRDGLWMAGTLVAAAAPAMTRALLAGGSGAPTEQAVFAALGLAYAALLVVLPWWCAAAVVESAGPPPATAGEPAPMAGTATGVASRGRPPASIWANRPYRILLSAYGVAALGGALPGTLLFFYVEHVLGAPAWGDALLGAYFLAGFAGLPVWTRLAGRFGKRPTFLIATALALAVFALALPLRRGDVGAFMVVTILTGTAFGATLTLPASMLADTIDYDELRSGRRREGLFVGVWGITTKLSAALGAGLALPALGWAGYTPGAAPPETAVLALRLLYCAVPSACYAAALTIAWRYPIDEAAHRAIGIACRARREGVGTNDPLTGDPISI